jgi:hypothetical protein
MHLLLVGLAAPKVLAAFQPLTPLFAEDPSVYWTFVLRQGQDVPVETTFSASGCADDGHPVTNRYRLVAVNQQYGASWEEIPHGWNTICAFQFLGLDPCLLAGLPLVSDWYEQRAIELVLTAQEGIVTA